jgi:hypothetical protein
MADRRGIVAACPLFLGFVASLALGQQGPEAPRPPSGTAPAGALAPEPSPGTGGPDEPTAATVAPTAEQAAQAEQADTRTLASLLGLDDTPVTVYGWIQNSFTGTPGIDPKNRSTVTVFPNRLANSWQGNQYYVVVEDPVEAGDRPNLGFRFDTLFGNDWLFSKSFGLFDGAFTPRGFAGVDFPQIYGEARLPLGSNQALSIKGGRFYSPAGYESVMAVKRPLLSVPYVFNFTPFTFVGALTSLQLGERLTLVNGAVNGADRWIDSNYHYSYLGGASWNSADGRSTLSSMTLVGPNQLPFFPSTNPRQTPTLPVGGYTSPELEGRRNPLYNRSTLVYHATVATRKWGKNRRWTQAMEAAFVTQGNVLGFGPGGSPGRIGYYGGAHWLLYDATPKLTAVSRLEVFRDNNGFVLPAPDNYYEMTYGLIYRPTPALWIRPEIRYDWAQFTRPYNDGTRGGQLTLACDVIVQF